MRRIGLSACLTLIVSEPLLACEVNTAEPARDSKFGNHVITVQVAPNERCVIIDQASEEGARQRRELWLPVEKLGVTKTDRFGRFFREYRVESATQRVDRYVYQAGSTPGEESVVFASFPDGQERRAVEYRIQVR